MNIFLYGLMPLLSKLLNNAYKYYFPLRAFVPAPSLTKAHAVCHPRMISSNARPLPAAGPHGPTGPNARRIVANEGIGYGIGCAPIRCLQIGLFWAKIQKQI
jgi:hypothetical protein